MSMVAATSASDRKPFFIELPVGDNESTTHCRPERRPPGREHDAELPARTGCLAVGIRRNKRNGTRPLRVRRGRGHRFAVLRVLGR